MFGSVIARLHGPSSFEGDIAPTLRERAAVMLPPAGAAPAAEAREMVPLTRLGRHATGVVAGVRLAPGTESDPALERMALRLIEIGFVQGERLRVVAFGQPGDDPIGVRIGGRGGSSTLPCGGRRRAASGCGPTDDRTRHPAGRPLAGACAVSSHVLDQRQIALLGNPNCGKTALFNLLTGSRQKVANYAGVTVERKEGRCARPSAASVACSTCRAPTA